MRKGLAFIGALLLLICSSTKVSIGDQTFEISAVLPGCTPNRCVIDRNEGGSDLEFYPVLQAINNRALRVAVVIQGTCVSWCAFLADMLNVSNPKLVCILPTARFLFHKEYEELTAGGGDTTYRFSDPPHSKPIVEWVEERGGFPEAVEEEGMLSMDYAEALKFWRPCTVQEAN
jgi:hypothetical protein